MLKYYVGLLEAYATEFEVEPLTNVIHATTIVAHSGVLVSGDIVVRGFCWHCHDVLVSSKSSYHDKQRMKWLVDRGIAELRKYYKANPDKIPGKSIHGDENAVDALANNNTKLVDNNSKLSANNTTLTNTNARLADRNVVLQAEKSVLQDKVITLNARLAAAQAQQPQQPANQPLAADVVPVTPARSTRSTAPRSTAKKTTKKTTKKTALAKNWEDEEEVEVLPNYKIKKYAGKRGVICINASTNDKLMVIFEDSKLADKLIDPDGLKSLQV